MPLACLAIMGHALHILATLDQKDHDGYPPVSSRRQQVPVREEPRTQVGIAPAQEG